MFCMVMKRSKLVMMVRVLCCGLVECEWFVVM